MPSAPKSRSSSTPRSATPLDRAVAEIRRRFPAFNERRLTWDDAVALAGAFHLPVHCRPIKADSAIANGAGRPWIAVSDRLDLTTWGVFCVVHELGHRLLHPGPRDFYLGSPGWMGKTESQANVIALLALWPHKPPYPKILKIDEDDGLVHLLVAFTTQSRYDFGARWTSRQLTLQRYR